jgi:uncharacterized protein YjbI with pentapeptide repeats
MPSASTTENGMAIKPMRKTALFRPVALAILAFLTALHCTAGAADDWAGYERLDREKVVEALAGTAPADFYAKNLSGLDLSAIDFKGANLAASVLNGSRLQYANLANCKLSVSFGEGADFSHADLSGAMMFSMQLKGANFKGAKLAKARFIGDMSRANLQDADLTGLRGSADMKNQSMGLMRASFVSSDLRRANFTGAELARADFSFADLREAKFVGANLSGAEFASSDLRGADLSGADLRGAKFIDTRFHDAILTGARFGGATWRGVQGMDNAAGRGATGTPSELR